MPYLTMDFGNEAGEIRALKRMIERGFVYRGLKPVYWCFDCGSSLAEFEIEYEDRKSQTLDVGFLCAEPDRLAAAFGLPALSKPAFAVIWTTTAWTLPANQALNLNPALDYALVDTTRGLLLLAAALVEQCLARYALDGTIVATTQGAALDGIALSPSAGRGASGLRPPRAGVSRRLRDRRRRHRHRPFGAGLRHRRLQLLHRARPGARRHPQAGARRRPLCSRAAAVRRHEHLACATAHRRGDRRERSAVRDRPAGAQLPALLAPQDAGDLPRRGAVVRAHGCSERGDCRRVHGRRGPADVAPRPRSKRSTRRRSIPRTAAPGCAT